MIHFLCWDHVISLVLGLLLLLLLADVLPLLLACRSTHCSNAVRWVAHNRIEEGSLEPAIQAILSNQFWYLQSILQETIEHERFDGVLDLVIGVFIEVPYGMTVDHSRIDI